jgi:hypothetical protein
MNKEFIPYEQALELKELGFNEPCFGYWKMSDWLIEEKTRTDGYTHADQLCSAPLFQQAFRWFREKYEIHTRINPHSSNDGNDNYIVDEYDWEMVHPKYFDGPYFEKYEDAELDCLKKLIEIVKNKKD